MCRRFPYPDGRRVFENQMQHFFTIPLFAHDPDQCAWAGFLHTDRNGKDLVCAAFKKAIHVGYKYYETRYEDKVLGRDKVGEYDYAATVQYPFGFGMSYTDFTWGGFNAADNGDSVTVSVDVSNAADGRDGSEVVQLYVGAPYTEGGIEKAAVSLCGFQKIKVEKGGSKTAEITVDKKALASYDAYGAKTYVLEAGDYYLTAAHNAHEAVNNILAAKAADGAELHDEFLAGEGDAAFVTKFTVAETETYDESNGVKIENQFDDVDLTNEACPAYDESFKYLTRSDWEGTFPVSYSTGKNSTVSNNLSGFVETRPISDVLYTVANSSAMNGVAYGANANSGIPNYVFILIAVDLLAAAGIVVLAVFAVKGVRRELGRSGGSAKKAK